MYERNMEQNGQKKIKSITDTCFVMKRQKTYLAEYIYRVSFVLTWMWRFVIFAFPTQVWCATGAHTMTARVCERLMWCNSVCHLQKSACVVSIIPGKSKFIFNRHLLISFSRIRGKTSDSKRKKNHSKIFFFFFFLEGWGGGSKTTQKREPEIQFFSLLVLLPSSGLTSAYREKILAIKKKKERTWRMRKPELQHSIPKSHRRALDEQRWLHYIQFSLFLGFAFHPCGDIRLPRSGNVSRYTIK